MARISLTSGFSLIPEGEYVFGIYDVTYDEDFGKMEVKMVTANGQKYTERFQLKNQNDEPNEGAMNAFSFFAKTALNRYDIEDIDHTDLIGHYIRARVIHTQLPSRNNPGKMTTFANLDRDKTPADGFDTTPTQAVLTMMNANNPVSSADIDLDALLG